MAPVRFLLAMLFVSSIVRADDPTSTLLFDSGREGYPRYRIPTLITTRQGTVIAFCEGRKGGRGLTGDIDIVCKSSLDSGKTWSELRVVADEGDNTLGNPCAVIDSRVGTIWLALTRSLGVDTEELIVDGKSQETTRVYLTKSSDDGRTWSPLREITQAAKRPDWTWYGTGPGIGVELQSGRLVIPCYHTEAKSKLYRSHMIYSDDHGESWRLGQPVGENCTECQVAERRDGTLYLTARSIAGEPTRTIAVSRDGGATWEPAQRDQALYDSSCQASLLVLPSHPNDGPRWLFCHPAGPDGRRNLTVRLSADEGRTWPVSLRLQPGDSQYSCLAQLPDGQIGCLYDRWADGNYRIYFAKFEVGQVRAR